MEETEQRRTKERSPNFPFITLQQALARTRAFYDQERKGLAPVTRAAIHWEYSAASSGLLQTIAALKSYGLMVDEGSGAERRLRLTELALRIVLDSRADSLERDELIRRASTMPTVSAEVQAHWPEGLPSDETLNHYLVLERGFSPSNSARAVKILKENHMFAMGSFIPNLSVEQTAAIDNESYEQARVADRPAPNFAEILQGSTKLQSSKREAHAVQHAPSEFAEQVIDPDGMTIRLEFETAPTLDSYEFLKDYIELRLKGMRRKAALATTVGSATKDHEETQGSVEPSHGLI